MLNGMQIGLGLSALPSVCLLDHRDLGLSRSFLSVILFSFHVFDDTFALDSLFFFGKLLDYFA